MAEETPADQRVADFITTDTYGGMIPFWQRRMLNQIRRNAPPPLSEENTEVLRWGTSEAVPGETKGVAYGGSRRLDENPDEKNEDKPTVIYTEVARKTSDVRVENPDDADQYVIVRRITEITFSGTDSRNHRFILNWPT